MAERLETRNPTKTTSDVDTSERLCRASASSPTDPTEQGDGNLDEPGQAETERGHGYSPIGGCAVLDVVDVTDRRERVPELVFREYLAGRAITPAVKVGRTRHDRYAALVTDRLA